MKTLVVLTGAGVSAESGVQTFRDAGGLWEGHDVMEVASPEGWRKNPELVLDFYNQRRAQLFKVRPNQGHLDLVDLERDFKVQIITQNVDDLHERAGSTAVLHLHGELFKVRSVYDENEVLEWKKDLFLGDVGKNGDPLRPHIVWFGEAVPLIPTAIEMVEEADLLAVIGTSLQVYPAASLLHYVKKGTPIYYVDPNPGISESAFPHLTIIREKAGIGVAIMRKMLEQ